MKTTILVTVALISGYLVGALVNVDNNATPLEQKLPKIIQMIEEERDYAFRLCFREDEIKNQDEFCGGYQAADMIIHNIRGILRAE